MGLKAGILASRLRFGIRASRLGFEPQWGGWTEKEKASGGQRYPLPLCEYMWVCDGERGSGPEGADDLCLVSFEALGLNLSINNGI